MNTPRSGMRAALHLLLWAMACATLAACQRTPLGGPLGQVAWVSDDSLWAQALPTGKPRLLGVAAGLSRLVYSPSGRWLAVHARDGVRLVRTDGAGGEKLSGPEGTAYAWAPTDDRVAYVAGGNLLSTRAGGIGTVLVDRTQAPAVTSVGWSPDGEWLVFTLDRPTVLAQRDPAAPVLADMPASALWRMPARGGEPAPLRALPPAWGPRGPTWIVAGAGMAALLLPGGRHRLVLEPGAGGMAALRLAVGGEPEGQVVARLTRAEAVAGAPADAPTLWTSLVAYSPR